jgi:KipI family sensor histidine kinase inhibitor
VKLLPYGPRAVLAEFGTIDEVMASSAAWRTARLAGVIDVVPAARTVLVVHDGSLDAALLVPAVTYEASASDVAAVTLDVDYDGEDLTDVAAACALQVEELIALHTGAVYTAAFCGFMPGFTYLVGSPQVLHLPRRASPRTRVPPGSVAIAAEFTGVYPRESPGGWHLLGRTDAVLWDESRDPAALLPPGASVRFRAR